MTEDQLEQETLGWLTDTGYVHCYGLDMAPDGGAPERSNYSQVLLVGRLREAINRLNPLIPLVAREDAVHQVLNLDMPVLLAANRAFHQLLVNGVPVEYQKEGETRGDFVRLIDFAEVSANEWLAVNQFSVKGAKYTRRPDIILFVNGLPLVLLELKNPADQQANIWKAYDQIQTGRPRSTRPRLRRLGQSPPPARGAAGRCRSAGHQAGRQTSAERPQGGLLLRLPVGPPAQNFEVR